ncbi:DJ-1/PfpI family protein [Candidatus Dependentiae bacterium]|nr:DJ-1/PfpI family protein [Candidatus Dependentiae bacterium]
MKRTIIIIFAILFSIVMVIFNLADTGLIHKKDRKKPRIDLNSKINKVGDRVDDKIADVGERIGLKVINLNNYNLQGTKVLMVIPPLDFRDEEFKDIQDILKKVEIKIVIASTTKKECIGVLKKERCFPELLINEVNIDDYDALIIIGGIGTKNHLWGNTDLNKLVFNFGRTSKPLGGLQLAPAIIADSNIAHGKNLTVYKAFDSLAHLKDGGANYVDKSIVIDGNIITANSPKTRELFAKKLILMIVEYQKLSQRR